MRLLLIAAITLNASPIFVTTTLTDQQNASAILGGASQAVYLEDFAGVPLGTEFSDWSLVETPPDWTLSAIVDAQSPGSLMRTPPIAVPTLPVNAPTPYDRCETVPAEVPEPGGFYLVGGFLAFCWILPKVIDFMMWWWREDRKR